MVIFQRLTPNNTLDPIPMHTELVPALYISIIEESVEEERNKEINRK